jgi:hypothetical protein
VLSRVSVTDGKPRWSIALRGAWDEDVRAAWLLGDHLLIMRTGEITAIDAASGARLYSTSY